MRAVGICWYDTCVCVCVCVCVFEVQLIVLFPVLQQGMVKCLLWV